MTERPDPLATPWDGVLLWSPPLPRVSGIAVVATADAPAGRPEVDPRAGRPEADAVPVPRPAPDDVRQPSARP